MRTPKGKIIIMVHHSKPSRAVTFARSRACIAALISILLVGCGGGGGGGAASAGTTDAGTNNTSSSAPSTGSNTTSSNSDSNPQVQLDKQRFLSDTVLETAFSINSYGDKLYLGTDTGLVEVNSATGTKRALAGNELITWENGGEGVALSLHDQKFVIDSGNVYVPSDFGSGPKKSRIAITQAASTGDLIVPNIGCCNFKGIAANANETFWFLYDPGANSINVYSQQHGRSNTNKKLLALPGQAISAVAQGDYLYLYVDKSIYRYQISNQVLRQLSQHTGSPYIQPLLASTAGVYWGQGGDIFFASNDSNTVQQLGNVVGSVKKLALSGTDLYVVHNEDTFSVPSGKMLMVSRLDTKTGAPMKLFEQSLDDTQVYAIASTESGKVYWADSRFSRPTGIYEIRPSGDLKLLLQPSTTELAWSVLMYATNNKLALSDGTRILIYSTTDGSTTGFYPVVRPNYFYGSGSDLFVGSYTGNYGIMRLSLDQSINRPMALPTGETSSGSWTEAVTAGDGYVYWRSGKNSGSGSYFEISRSRLDGSDYSVLVRTTGELKDPVLNGTRLYFLCKESCGAQGWVIASLTTNGENPRLDANVELENPRLYTFKDKGYLVGAYEYGRASAIFSFDFTSWTVSQIASEVPSSRVVLAFSDKWLYWGAYSGSLSIARHQWINWDKIDTVQYIEGGPAGSSGLDGLRADTIHSSNGYLYYWNNGLIRVKE